MTPIVSKRHPFKFYLAIVLTVLLFFSIATAILFDYYKSLNDEQQNAKENLLLILAIACYAFAGYSLYRYIKNAPTIKLDKDFIYFNRQAYSIAEIDKIYLTGKQPFNYAINVPMEAATLKFKNGDIKYIFDDMYSNSWEMKSFLKTILIDKSEFISNSILQVDKNGVETDFYDTFKGNQFSSFRGILLWGMIIFFIYIILNGQKPVNVGAVVMVAGFALFWFIAFSFQMHYFQVSNKYFLVRNHNFFWKRKVYNISDIKEIVFETQGKMPNCLRVITTDFKSKLYPAGTLRNDSWLELKDKFENFNIEVRNECV